MCAGNMYLSRLLDELDGRTANLSVMSNFHFVQSMREEIYLGCMVSVS